VACALSASSLAAHELFLKLATYFLPAETPVRVLLLNGTFSKSEGVVARDRIAGGARALDRYLKRFGDIRRIQDYLVARAERLGVPVIDASDGDAALRVLLDLILERASVQPDAVP